jgi:hypothetical protein
VREETGRRMSARERRSVDPDPRIPTQHDSGLPACLVNLSSAWRFCNNRKPALPAVSLGSRLPQAVTVKDAPRPRLPLAMLAQSDHPRSGSHLCTARATSAGFAVWGCAWSKVQSLTSKVERRRSRGSFEFRPWTSGLGLFSSLTASRSVGCNEQTLTRGK